MTNDEVREYLRAQLEKKMKGLEGAGDMFQSMFEGSKRQGQKKVDPLDVQAGFSFYRGLVEASTLIKIYNDNFPGNNYMDGLQRIIDPNIEIIERNLNIILGVGVNAANREE